jgi:hypothetical protein
MILTEVSSLATHNILLNTFQGVFVRAAGELGLGVLRAKTERALIAIASLTGSVRQS